MKEGAYDHVRTSFRVQERPDQSPPIDFATAMVQTVVLEPLRSASQVINHTLGVQLPEVELVVDPRKNNYTKAGTFAGQIVQFAILAKATGALTAGTRFSGPIMRGALNGLALAAVTPVYDDSKNYWTQKGQMAGIYAGTFAVMGGASQHVGKLSFLGKEGSRTFLQHVGKGTIAGAIGGVANAELSSGLTGNGLASTKELLTSTATYAAFGGLAAAADFGIDKLVKTIKADLAPYSIDEARQRMRFTQKDNSNVYLTYGSDGQPTVVEFSNYRYNIRYRLDQSSGKPVWLLDAEGRGAGLAGSHTLYADGAPTDASFRLEPGKRGLVMNYRPLPDLPFQVAQPDMISRNLRIPDGTELVKATLPKKGYIPWKGRTGS